MGGTGLEPRRDRSELLLRAVDEFEDRLSITLDRFERPLSNVELLDAVKTLEWHGPLAHGRAGGRESSKRRSTSSQPRLSSAASPSSTQRSRRTSKATTKTG